jgi:RNA polymerase subunit RPABC4/transcription elongation factor Spt4
MADYPSIVNWDDEETRVAQVPSESASSGRLIACPDCGRGCSAQAETCPGCGRYFRAYTRSMLVIPGDGWVSKVAWGIVLSSFLWGFILMGVFMVGVFLVFILFGAGAALVPQR